jgi:hypothetical protein
LLRHPPQHSREQRGTQAERGAHGHEGATIDILWHGGEL